MVGLILVFLSLVALQVAFILPSVTMGLITILFFITAWYEVRQLKKEIVEYELLKSVNAVMDSNDINEDMLNNEVSRINQMIRDGSLWRKTDYVQRRDKINSGKDN